MYMCYVGGFGDLVVVKFFIVVIVVGVYYVVEFSEVVCWMCVFVVGVIVIGDGFWCGILIFVVVEDINLDFICFCFVLFRVENIDRGIVCMYLIDCSNMGFD